MYIGKLSCCVHVQHTLYIAKISILYLFNDHIIFGIHDYCVYVLNLKPVSVYISHMWLDIGMS